MIKLLLAAAAAGVIFVAGALAQSVPDRSLGEGPYDRLVIRGATVIDGAGAPPIGPMDIAVEGGRITEIKLVGAPGLPIPEDARIAAGTREIDASEMYVAPGFVNLHGHIHDEETGQGVSSDYIFKLWLAHGITSVRDVGNRPGAKWTADLARRSARNEIDAPSIYPYPMFGRGGASINTPAQARAQIRSYKSDGAVGVKFIGAPPEILWAAFDEAQKLDLKTTMHHAQLSVVQADVLDTSARGLNSMEHWYGLPEALFDDRTLQDYPLDYNYADEQHRFENAGKLWRQAAGPGSERWEHVMSTLLERDFAMVPTFTIYLSSRDWMRARRAEWHDEYTMPSLWKFFTPDRNAHGSYWFDWGTEQEVAWRENYQLWMRFINDYKNRGGSVGVGEDAGYIYSTYGFGFIQEMELFREAGFHPLEVIGAATLGGAKILGVENETGSIQVGKRADLIITRENPLTNMKTLYASGHIKLDPVTNKPVRVGGIDYVVKNGLVYDGAKLRESIKQMVSEEKAKHGIGAGPMPIVGFEISEDTE